jgi:hypothetical protein
MEPRVARRALAGAILAGVLADLMFDRVALGINVPLATVAILIALAWLGERRPIDPLDLWLPVVALLAALGPAFRTDPSVIPLDLGLAAAAVGAWSFAVRGVAVTRGTTTAITALGARGVVALGTGFATLLARSGADGYFSRGTRQFGRLAPIARGALIALPIVFGFSVLLSSADAVFGRALDEALHLPLDLDEVIGRATFSILAAVLVAGPIAIAGGALRGWPGAASPGSAEPVPIEGEVAGSPMPARDDVGRRPGATEALIVLVAVDVLFAAFAVVQVVYLFGGADTLALVGMTYSDYARQGYFQLAFVVALAGVLLLGAHEVMGRTRGFVIAALGLMLLTGVILASAAFRLRLYQDAYGWTELRFFVAASIAWLAACVVLAIVLVGWGRMRWLPHGIALAAVAITLAVTAIGPQAFVMHQNLARVLDPGLVPPGGRSGIDLHYGMTLGDDAIPDLVAALALVPAPEGSTLLDQLHLRREELERDTASQGPLSWNLARERAREALARLPGR